MEARHGQSNPYDVSADISYNRLWMRNWILSIAFTVLDVGVNIIQYTYVVILVVIGFRFVLNKF